MIERLKKIRPVKLIVWLLAGLIYPAVKWINARPPVSTEEVEVVSSNIGTVRLLAAMNAATVAGLFLIMLGIICIAVMHGDFDVTEYNLMRFRNRHQEKIMTFEDYKADKKQTREGSFNYPLLTGVLLLVISAVVQLFY